MSTTHLVNRIRTVLDFQRQASGERGITPVCVRFKHGPNPSWQLLCDFPFHRVNRPKRAFEGTGFGNRGAIEVKPILVRKDTIHVKHT